MSKDKEFPAEVMDKGVYPANKKGHAYMPAPYHGSKTHTTRGGRKTKWTVDQNGQHYIFNYADERDWMDNIARGLFSFYKKCKESIGSNGERLAFFPKPSNDFDPWHGYPVFSDEMEDMNLVEKWAQDGEINVTTKQRLLRQAI